MLDLARSGNLKFCEKILLDSRPTLPANERIIKSGIEFMEIALDCVYAYKRIDQWDAMLRISQMMPSRLNAEESLALDKTDLQKLSKLHDRTDKFETHLNACRILST